MALSLRIAWAVLPRKQSSPEWHDFLHHTVVIIKENIVKIKKRRTCFVTISYYCVLCECEKVGECGSVRSYVGMWKGVVRNIIHCVWVGGCVWDGYHNN